MTKDQFQTDLERQIENMENDLAQLKEDLQSHIEDNCDHLFAVLDASCKNCGISRDEAIRLGWAE